MGLKSKVLVVDDTPASLRLLTDLLKAEGYDVRSAICGELALNVAPAYKPDLILLDIRMPDMDGFEVCQKLKANEITKDIAIIFVSAASEVNDKIKGFELGGVDYVTKPFQRLELLARVRTQLELAHLRIHLEDIVKERTLALSQSEERYRQAMLAANAANAAKSQFLTNMSHEIRTPLNSLIGLTEILLDSNLSLEQQRYAQIANAAGENLLFLINDILDLSRIESGTLSIEKIPFSLKTEIDKCFNLILVRAKEKNLELKWSIDQDISDQICGDPTRLRQVILNLLGNSVKFSNRGTIELKVCKFDGPDSQNKIHFIITDQGIGIPEDKFEIIFEPFKQVDPSITRKFGGSGLGLAISKKLVEQMNGKIWVESHLGQGSSFHFTAELPATQEKVEKLTVKTTQTKTNSPLTKPLQILLVDDSKDNQILIEAFLKDLNCKIIEADNGLDALEKYKLNHFDLVFMDVQMPIMDGYTATREIRNWESQHGQKHVPILAITAHAYDSDINASIEAGCNDHIVKPLKKGVVLDALKKYSMTHNSL